MDHITLAALGIGSISGAYHAGKGLVQISKASKLKLKDSRTDADRAALTIAKMRANSQRMPGMAQAIDNINQDAADARKALEQTATSSSAFLGACTLIHQDKEQRLSQLKAQSATYQEFAKRELATELRRQSALQQPDKDEYEQAKAILKKKAYLNIFTGVIICGFAWLCTTARESPGRISN